MNTARAIYTNESYRIPELNTKILLSDNFIERMKRLDHTWLATLLQNAGIIQQKIMPNIPVPILVDSISRNNPTILSAIKNYLNTRNSSKYRMVCLEKWEWMNSIWVKTFFYTSDPEWKILKEIWEKFIPECIRSYINWIRTEGIISGIEDLYTTNALTLNSLSSTSEQVNKASFIIQLIETTTGQITNKNPKEGYAVTWNLAVKDESRARIFDLLWKKAKFVGMLWKPNKPVLTSSWAYGKWTWKVWNTPDNIRPIKFKWQQ